jgi:transposase
MTEFRLSTGGMEMEQKDRRKRDRTIAEAVEKYGYTQRSIAEHLDMHYSYISQILSELEQT